MGIQEEDQLAQKAAQARREGRDPDKEAETTHQRRGSLVGLNEVQLKSRVFDTLARMEKHKAAHEKLRKEYDKLKKEHDKHRKRADMHEVHSKDLQKMLDGFAEEAQYFRALADQFQQVSGQPDP